MIKIYKDVFFWSYVTIWLILTLGAWFITGNADISIAIINPIMIMIFAIIVQIRFKNDKFYNWLETPLKKYDQRD